MIITDTQEKTFDKIAMDIVGPFNITKNNNKYILCIQDQLSKFIILVCLREEGTDFWPKIRFFFFDSLTAIIVPSCNRTCIIVSLHVVLYSESTVLF